MATTGLVARALTRSTTAARSYAPASYDATPVPTALERHYLNRLGAGFSVRSFRELRAAGGAQAWFAQQLEPASVTENARAAAIADWFPDLRRTPAEIWQTNQQGTKEGWEYARDLANAALLRRAYSSRTVLESMVGLWSDHLHVHASRFPAFTQRPAYDETIRAHALGRFEDLLVATTLHPAMLLYLDNWKSVRNAPNENHGRELLELHTVGRSAGYTEQMVKDAARILSGWTVVSGTWQGIYDPNRHTTGPVSVLGFTHANGSADGSSLTEGFLRYLARHPATAQRVCRKMAARFVGDDPSPSLVDRLAATYTESGTDIAAVLRVLVASDEFRVSVGQKVRTPIDDCVATVRALDVRADAPADLQSFAHQLCWAIDSTIPFQWPTPDGPPDRAGAWASQTRLLNSWRMHWSMAGGWWPKGQVVYRPATWWLPQPQIRFDLYVDHLCRTVLGRRSNARLLAAACLGADVAPGETVTRTHAVASWKLPRVVAALLDSPDHLSR